MWHRIHSYMKKKIRDHRKQRYRKIKKLSSERAILRAAVIFMESLVLGEKPIWDYQYAKTQSPIERRLYNALKRKGYKIKTQVRCGKYFIDIALPRHKIAIECDGKPYHSSYNQKQHDARKNKFLRDHGWKVLRFSGSQINGKLKWVLSKIEKLTINR